MKHTSLVVGRSSLGTHAWTNDQRLTTNDVFMRIAYLECFSGISGDMFLGALVDAGVSPQVLQDTVAALGVGAKLEISKVLRSGISATKVDVWVDGEKDMPREQYWAKQDEVASKLDHEHSHTHDHGHSHNHSHDESSSDDAAPHKHEHPHRGLTEIRRIISAAAISEAAKKTAIRMFEALGTAEAKIHNVPIETIHFHEVGAVDAIVDIVCAAVGAEALGVDEIICSPLNVGGGTVKCAHGTFPVPAPATLELLRGATTYSSGVQAELVTPTGAAIAATLSSRFSSFPQMTIETSAYGAGSRDFSGHPNVLRIVIGEHDAGALCENEIRNHLRARSQSRRPEPSGVWLRNGQAVRGRRSGRIRNSGPDEEEPSRDAPDGTLQDGRRGEDHATPFRGDLDFRHPPPRRVTPDAGPALGKRAHRMGRSSHQDCQHEWNSHQLRAGV